MSIAIVTIIAKNYLAHARVLARSLARHHPEVPLFVVLGDEGELRDEPFRIISLADLGISRRFLFHYNRQQTLTAIKPHALRTLLERGFTRALYLDADILVIGDLSPVLAPDGDPSIWLTPHLLDPPRGDDRADRELRILLSGAYNGGCIGVSQSEEALRFLTWWQKRLATHSRRDIVQGMFYDQKWLDHVPIFFEHSAIIRDRACNIAYWNIDERDVTPRFFHFSGFDPRQPSTLSIHWPRAVPPSLAPLFHEYARELDAAGYAETHALPWAYDAFSNEIAIPDFVRTLPHDFGDDPFATAYDWLQSPIDHATPVITNLWNEVYAVRADLQRTFPDHRGADRAAFIAWTRSSGLREHAIGDEFAL